MNRNAIKVLLLLLGLFSSSGAHGQEKPELNLPLHFEDNRIFSASELSAPVEKCLTPKSQSSTLFTIHKLESCLSRLQLILHSKGYLQARVGKPQQFESEAGLSWLISVTEGRRYRLGQVKIERARLLSPDQIRVMLDLQTGDVVDTDRIYPWLYGRVARMYKNSGYLQFSAEIELAYYVKSSADDGIADLKVTIDEGPAFTIKSITFEGREEISNESLVRQMLVAEGEVFKQDVFEESLKKIAQDGPFETIDPDKDVDFRTEREGTLLNLRIRLRRKTP